MLKFSSKLSRRTISALVLASGASVALAGRPIELRTEFSGVDASEATLLSWDVINVGDGLWSVATNWDPQLVPAFGDDVRLFESDATDRTVTYDSPGGTTLNSLRIDSTGNGIMTLAHGTHTLISNEVVTGIFGKGRYNLSGGTLQSGIEYVGSINDGTFTQSGGRHINSVFLSIGNNAGAKGQYYFSGGTLSGAELDVGYYGAGTMFHSGGTATLSQYYGVGFVAGGVGTYIMFGTARMTAPAGYVGLYGSGTMIQGGGTQTILQNLSLGETTGSSGYYKLAGGVTSASEFNVGYEGTGSFEMTGGTLSVGTFFVAAQDAATGRGDISGGVVNVANNYDIAAGSNTTASVRQGPGVVTVGNDMTVAYADNSVGTYNLEGGTLSSNKLKVGFIGNGVFTQENGTHTVNTYVSIADQAASISTYAMRSGSLTANELEVGYRGRGSMLHSGGQVTINDFTAVGFVTSGLGFYEITGGTLTSPSVYVGLYGTGTMSATGGRLNAASILSVGENTGAAGTLNIGNTATVVAGEFDVGFQGTGYVNQSNGNVTATELNVAGSLGGIGSYYMTGGTLTVGDENISFTTTNVGSFRQEGGTHTVSNVLNMAVASGTTASFELNGGRLSAASINIGGGSTSLGGVATMDQGGGVINVANRVRIYGGSTLTLAGGSFSVGSVSTNGGGQMRVAAGSDVTPRVKAIQGVSGKIDLTDNSLLVDYTGPSPIGGPLGPFGTIANLIANGWNNGSWDGLGINTSTGSAFVYAIGYDEASNVFGISGAGTATFRGQTVDATTVITLFTFYGDANLDRKVDINDFAILGANFNTAGKLWKDGDFNYSGNVSIADFALMAANFNQTYARPAIGNNGDGGIRASAVPEPASMGLLALAATGLLRRRRD